MSVMVIVPLPGSTGLKEVTLTEMERYDRPVGIGSLISVDTTAPVEVAAVAAEIRPLHGRIGPWR
jgi:hypothetical protein